MCVSPTTVNNAVLESGTFQLTCAQHPPSPPIISTERERLMPKFSSVRPQKHHCYCKMQNLLFFPQNKWILRQIHQVGWWVTGELMRKRYAKHTDKQPEDSLGKKLNKQMSHISRDAWINYIFKGFDPCLSSTLFEKMNSFIEQIQLLNHPSVKTKENWWIFDATSAWELKLENHQMCSQVLKWSIGICYILEFGRFLELASHFSALVLSPVTQHDMQNNKRIITKSQHLMGGRVHYRRTFRNC